MDLSGIISISGRPGLYKVVAQGKNSIIVQSLIDNKRFPAYSTDRISALEDISIYTVDDDKPLKDILTDIFAKQEGKAAPSHKEDISILQDFLSDILPDYDEERVYPSDIKKLFQWYNLLLSSGNLKPEDAKASDKELNDDSTETYQSNGDSTNDDSTKTTSKASKAPAKKKPAASASAKASSGTQKKAPAQKKD
ncbi:MAG: DUF5606 domain-containing protein [Crocinitomicaceae bacterium]|nr:DUF5606 domain-containing protein [Crocinitomicaceae bacterium]